VRGADLLDTTPRQVWLAGRLGLPVPRYVHVPLVLGPDGSRLAKRGHRSPGRRQASGLWAVTLADRAALGQDAEAVRGLLAASLGLAAPGERPGMRDLVDRFDPATVPTEPWTLTA
jgi:glutamyl-tRNA synthetase